MKIGIITYHNTINFGAALQTYSTVRALKMLGTSPEVIDYRKDLIESRKRLQAPRLSIKSIPSYLKMSLKNYGFKIKNAAFEKFSNSFLQLSPSTYRTLEELKTIEDQYDLYLVGSDQVWNYQLNGKDPAYFLQFAKDSGKTASFSSSFGLSSIPEDMRTFYQDGLNSLSSISVRESMGADLVKELTGRTSVVNADPVFLTTPEDWREMARANSNKGVEGALASYFLGPELREKADALIANSELRGKIEVKLAGGLSVKDLISRKVSVRIDRGPLDFIRVLDQSSFVLTGSFHATAFAILLDKPFAVLLKGDAGKDARILELLRTFSLLDRVAETASDLRFDPPSSDKDTRKVIDELRGKSVSYLSTLIG
ncbi:polysaccharide pyruvyl transferase family protein [Corynebacterium callunae]|uniref:polysaccharide pyruvyl transferase family protein n=1 Tax=Corynebacterium callunae TaxID=1721 RepID=UPI001FFF2C84|nr:polysaccharide pyruvyl transferase family protein [Corynebacterium callunae]MCK2199740.1 polysaccharide pyruvyl transferase family protein [Corynebacterium callunae]